MKHEASCSCGQLKLVYTGEITKTTMCHCLECQKRTGSVFAVQTTFDRNKSIITGNSTVFKRTGDEGTITSFHFCPKCGSTVYYESDWLGEKIAIPIETLSDPSLPMPKVDIYRNRKHHWVILPDDIIEYLG